MQLVNAFSKFIATFFIGKTIDFSCVHIKNALSRISRLVFGDENTIVFNMVPTNALSNIYKTDDGIVIVLMHARLKQCEHKYFIVSGRITSENNVPAKTFCPSDVTP